MEKLLSELNSLRNPKKAEILKRFFKTGKGEYGEGDVFIGISVPEQRKIAKKYGNQLEFKEIKQLIDSPIHEHRSVAIIILVEKYKKAKKDRLKQREIFEFYIRNTERINNWDLVDISAPTLLGDFCLKNGTEILRSFANSKNLWERRMAIVSTYAFIRKRLFGETLAISERLMNDEHDLIFKAVGWMLREVGKRNKKILELFLLPRYKKMPRTMLRYAIEKFPPEERQKYLKGEIE